MRKASGCILAAEARTNSGSLSDSNGWSGWSGANGCSGWIEVIQTASSFTLVTNVSLYIVECS